MSWIGEWVESKLCLLNLEGQGMEIIHYGTQGKNGKTLRVLIGVMVGGEFYFERSFWLL